MRRTLLAVMISTLVPVVPALASDGAALLDDAFTKAIKANDVKAVVSLYGKDAVLYPPDAPAAKGPDAIRAYYAALLAKSTVQEFTRSDAHYYSVGTLSAGWGSWTVTTVPKAGGAPVTTSGQFTEVARAEKAPDGSWVWFYVVDHVSARPPAGP